MRRNLLILLLTAISTSTAYADFTYNGQPIHPNCISPLVDMFDEPVKQVKISECMQKNHDDKVSLSEGFVTTKSQNKEQMEPYKSYKILSNYGDLYLVEFAEWGGGTGLFSNIVYLRKLGDLLQLMAVVASGDRCNGGVSGNGYNTWQFAINLTPADLIKLGKNPVVPIKSYEELDASAASCIGRAIYQFNYNTMKSTFLSVRLNNRQQPSLNNERISYQQCFDKLINSYVVSSTLELNQEGINFFVSQFNAQCLRQ